MRAINCDRLAELASHDRARDSSRESRYEVTTSKVETRRDMLPFFFFTSFAVIGTNFIFTCGVRKARGGAME